DAAAAAAVASGDALDGVTDGVIDDPSGCTYDPKELVGTKVGDGTFIEADAGVVRKIWEGPRGRDGKFLGTAWRAARTSPRSPGRGVRHSREGPSPYHGNGSSTSCSRTRNGTGPRSRRRGSSACGSNRSRNSGPSSGPMSRT